jgi:predicted ATPase
MGQNKAAGEARYVHGEYGKGTWTFYGGHDPGACCHYFSAWILWLAGKPVQAVAAAEAAMALANQLAHPPTTAIGLTWACGLYYLDRDVEATGHHAQRLINLSTEYDLPAWRAAGLVFDGWARAETGERLAGVTQIQEGVAASKTTGTLLSLAPLYMLALADALLKCGQPVEGLSAVDETLASMATSGVRVFLSEFHRVRDRSYVETTCSTLTRPTHRILCDHMGRPCASELAQCL